jgi:hypothetical protein
VSNVFVIFGDQVVGSFIASCPAKPGKWDQECVRKIFCSQDPALVKDLSAADVFTAENLQKQIWVFDGSTWKLESSPIKGAAGVEAGKMTIEMEADQTCESAATFIYHELWHTKQKPGMTVRDRETEAYRKTEEWCLKHPPMTQGFQKTDKGVQVVDDDAIKKHVEKNYPVPKPGDAEVIDHKMEPRLIPWLDAKPMSLVEDPVTHKQTWVPSLKGHKHAKGIVFNGSSECHVDPAKWTCP